MTGTLVERLAQLGPAQRELVEQRLGRPPATVATLTPEGRTGSSPASSTQRSMWFVHHLDPASPVLNNGSAVRIRGPLDVGALSAAITDLIRRHEILRTTYRLVDGELVQTVQPPPEAVLEVVRGRARDPDQLHLELEAETSRPFDLERDLMYRAVLHEVGDDDHVLLRSSHHIAFDRWSLALANREIGESYAARLGGCEPELPLLPVQYRDFARWQAEKLSADTADTRLRFFEAHVAGAPAYLDVPVDHPRTRAQGPATTLGRRMPDHLAHCVRKVARDMGATPFMVLLAVYGILMGRYTRADQFLVGVPVALRTEPPLADLVGPFINTVAMRLDLRGDPTFRDLVERVRRASLGVIAHQDLPFDDLVRTVAPDRVATRTPLFQVMFDYLNTPHAELALPGLALEDIALGTTDSAHDLTLYVEDRRSSIGTRWEYRADLFEGETVAALAGAYESLVGRLLAEPGSRIADVGLLDPSEAVRIGSIAAGPTLGLPWTSVLDALEAQRASTPEAVAVESAGTTLSYDELAAMARHVAVRLRDGGLGPADTVALVLDRSPRLVAALLGVMMAGGTAVLLDGDQPALRLSEMIRTVEPALVLTEGRRAVAPDGAPVMGLETLDELGGSGTTGSFAPLVPIDRTQPAYAVFTSGSAGRPKCVLVGHASLGNFVGAARSTYGLGPRDRVLQFASPGFDTFIEEVLPILSVGGAVVLRPPELFPSFEAFERFTDDRRITVLDLPTAWWHSWVADVAGSGRSLPADLRMVIVGGEAARSEAWMAWRTFAGDVRWVNSYGPSEATVVVATFEPPPDYRPTTPTMPIGRPIPNTSLLVVDSDGHAVPTRVTGELVIEGAAVALGYLGDDPKDAFLDGGPSGRRYRTGDLARLLPDGTLVFEGRVDAQVKVRGTRVEPTEVEAALRAHPQILDAVVVPDAGSGLVGHLVLRDAGELDPIRIRSHLSERLPEPMIPGKWRVHETLPMTPGGKHDRRRLQRSDGHQPSSRVDRVAPRSELERQLADLWSSVLDVPDISMTDSFFDLGGHSLLGVKLISQVSSNLGVQLPLRVLFEAPTVEAMARTLSDETRHAALQVTHDSLIPVRVEGEGTPFFCVHGAGGGVFFVGDLANRLDANRPIYGLQARGFEAQPGPYRTIEQLADGYLREIRSVQPRGPYLLGGLSLGGKIAFEMARQLVQSGDEVALVAMIDTQERPGDRNAGPGRHRARLRSMGPVEGLAYVARGTRKRVARTAKRGLIKYHLRRGRPLPDTLGLRNLYFYPMHAEADRAYVPEAYPGRVAVIASEGKTQLHEDTWGRVALGGFSVDEIATTHAGLLESPNDVVVAGHLQRLLDDADPRVRT